MPLHACLCVLANPGWVDRLGMGWRGWVLMPKAQLGRLGSRRLITEQPAGAAHVHAHHSGRPPTLRRYTDRPWLKQLQKAVPDLAKGACLIL